MHHLALNILPGMQGRKQLRSFRRVKSCQLLCLITGCHLPAILIWQVLFLAKSGKPYSDGEYIKNCFINASEELFQDFKNKADILKRIKELPLSAKTIKDRTIKMCLNITTQHIKDLKLVSSLSIAVDESCDINDAAQVSLFVRFMSHSGLKELLGLLPFKDQMHGEDIAKVIIECMDKHHIPLDKILSISQQMGPKLKLLIITNSKNFYLKWKVSTLIFCFITRCCASKEESANLKKHELIAKAFQKRHQLNQGHISLSLNSHNEDPIGMNLDGSSLASGDISSSWAMALPYFISRRNAITDLTPFTPRHYSSASDISRHVSLDSYNQQNLDSASLQISEQEYVLRHQRRKTRKERMRLWKTNRWFPSTRRGSDTSLQSSLTASIVAAAKSTGAKVSKSTSTGDLVPSPIPVYPPCLLPPVIPQPNKRSAIPREVINPPFTHGMTDNSHRLECRNLPSSIGTPSSSQRITPNPMNTGFHNPMNRFAPPPMYGQGFDVLNSLSFGLMGGVMYPTINGVYNEYSFNHAPYSSMIYATCGSYQNSNTTLNHIHPSELPMQARIESSSEAEYFPIIMSDSEFTDTGQRSYDEAQLMTTHRLMRERAQTLAAAAAAAATTAGNQLDPSQPKAVLEPQACAKTEFLKRLDLCNPKPVSTAAPTSRPPTTDRRSPHSEAPPPSPADSVKSISVDYEDDDVFECSINDAKETSVTSNVEEPEDESLLQKLKSKFRSAVSVSRTNLEQSESIELSSKPCCNSEFSATGNDTTPLKNLSKEKCLDPSESVGLIQAKDGNENVSR
ncbi:protein smoothened [Trichonephila clavipes]|nr:protein smoothened [Trichonephila clavipes]